MSKRRSTRSGLAFFLATMMISGLTNLAVAAQPTDPDASYPPETGGPLVGLQLLGCEDNGEPGPGAANGQSCSWFYELLPAESNIGEDFGAYWIQMEIDPGDEWCAKELVFEVEPPSGGRITGASADVGGRVSPGDPSRSELVVDAEGAAPVPGTIAQDVVYGSGTLSVDLDEHLYSFRWKGSSRQKVVVAIGVEIAHAALPQNGFSLGRERVGFSMGPCRSPRTTPPKRSRFGQVRLAWPGLEQ